MLQSDAYVEGRGFHLEYRQLRCKNSTNMVPEALTLRKGLQEQTVKTALFISGKNGKTDNTSSSNNATTMVNANATELSAKVGTIPKIRKLIRLRMTYSYIYVTIIAILKKYLRENTLRWMMSCGA